MCLKYHMNILGTLQTLLRRPRVISRAAGCGVSTKAGGSAGTLRRTVGPGPSSVAHTPSSGHSKSRELALLQGIASPLVEPRRMMETHVISPLELALFRGIDFPPRRRRYKPTQFPLKAAALEGHSFTTRQPRLQQQQPRFHVLCFLL